MSKRADFYTGIVIFLVAVAIYMNASQLPSDLVGIGAKGFPQFVAVCLGGLGILLSLTAFLKIRREGNDPAKIEVKEIVLAALLVIGFALYLQLLKPLGYLIATPIFFFVFGAIYGDKKWLRLGITSVVFTIVVWLLFEKLFYIMLPHGIL